jgi:HEPN domain-containing protein
MKHKHDLVSGWLSKAENDLRTLAAAINVESYDTACFHAQQAAEKALKAFLINAGIEFPFTHNLVKLTKLCSTVDDSFTSLEVVVEPLTPFAVELRYDAEFWPEKSDALDAERRARTVVEMARSAIGEVDGD